MEPSPGVVGNGVGVVISSVTSSSPSNGNSESLSAKSSCLFDGVCSMSWYPVFGRLGAIFVI